MLKPIRNRGREIVTTSVSIEILHTFESLGEEVPFLPVQSFFPPPSLILEVKKNSGMVSLLRGSCNLAHNSGILGLWLPFASSFLEIWVTLLEAHWKCLSSEKAFLLVDVHLENPKLSKLLVEPKPMDLLLPPREMILRITAPNPWTALQGGPLKGLLLVISKIRKVVCGLGIYSHGLGFNIACFCSLLCKPMKSVLDFSLELTFFENSSWWRSFYTGMNLSTIRWALLCLTLLITLLLCCNRHCFILLILPTENARIHNQIISLKWITGSMLTSSKLISKEDVI